jgi:hypothetical protein
MVGEAMRQRLCPRTRLVGRSSILTAAIRYSTRCEESGDFKRRETFVVALISSADIPAPIIWRQYRGHALETLGLQVHSGYVRCNRSVKCRDRRPVRAVWTMTCLRWTLTPSAVGSACGAQRLKRCLVDHRRIGGGEPGPGASTPLIGDGGHGALPRTCRQHGAGGPGGSSTSRAHATGGMQLPPNANH